MRDNNKVIECLVKEVQGDMEELVVHMDPLIYMRKLLEDYIYHAMENLHDGV